MSLSDITKYTMASKQDIEKVSPLEKWGDYDINKLDEFKLTGKHKDRTFKDVYENEKQYIEWVKKDTKFIKNTSTLALFRKYLQRKD